MESSSSVLVVTTVHRDVALKTTLSFSSHHVLTLYSFRILFCFSHAGRTSIEITKCRSWKKGTLTRECSCILAPTKKLAPPWQWGLTISAAAWPPTRPRSTFSTALPFLAVRCWALETTGSPLPQKLLTTCPSFSCCSRGAGRNLRSTCGNSAGPAWPTLYQNWRAL